MKNLSLSFALLFLSYTFVCGQYKSKTITVAHEEYEGTIEVCENCADLKPTPDKIYAYFHNGEVVVGSESSFKGQVLHGKANLKYKEGGTPYLQAEFVKGEPHGNYKEWIPDGLMLKEENYNNGIKHGKSTHYLFGKLETEEVYNQGKLVSVTYFTADTEKPERKIEYLQDNGSTKKARTIFMSPNGNIIEVEQVEIWEGKNLKANYYDGSYKKRNASGDKEQGTYSQNIRVGEWKQFLSDGTTIVRKYDNDKIVSEVFMRNGQNLTGVAIDKTSTGRLLSQYNVKNGIRDGQSLDSVGRKGYITNYQNGKADIEELNFEDFLKANAVSKEFKLKKQCDGRGKGLYIDKMQLTDKYTIVYCHYISQLKGNSTIYTPKAGTKDAFTMQINDNKEVKNLIKHFYISTEERPKSMWYGEMFHFVLVFDKISPNTRNISFVEGAEAYTTKPDGSYTYNWGCYEIELK